MNATTTYRWMFLSLLLACITGCEENNTSSDGSQQPQTTGIREKSGNSSLDKSPLDISYYPPDYPKLKMTGNVEEPLVARVIYSRPSVEGRKIFGTLLKFGKPWRLGANEATEIEFFQPVIIANTEIPAGRYILYCKPYDSKWTLILNSDLYTWGLKIDSTKDLHSFEIPVQRLSGSLEVFTMEFGKNLTGPVLNIAWDSIRIEIPFHLNHRPADAVIQ